MARALEAYRAKRDFAKTPEPKGGKARGKGDRFVIQKHAATRLHYDLRLELDGVYKSWAVTRGPSLVPAEKRLAVHVEDHPLEYGTFEGAIPKGEYGGGTVLLWDRGRWLPEGDAHAAYAKGHLTFHLEGEKLKGAWHLVRMRPRPREKKEQWLLIKSDDEWARAPGTADIVNEAPRSVESGRTIEEIAADPGRTWSSKGGGLVEPPPAPSKPKPGTIKGARKGALPDFVEPSLATRAMAAPADRRWVHEIKWDGYRLIARIENGRTRLLTRRGLDWTDRFPAIARALRALPAEAAMIDGEAIVEDESGVSSFSMLQDALSEGRAANALFYAFDLLHLDGFDLRPAPLAERKRALALLLETATDGHLRISEHMSEDGAAFFRHACRLGLEGIISKRSDLPYRSGRTDAWLKLKCSDREDFVIAGFMPSTTLRKAVGSLVLGYYDDGRLVHVGRTGTGFTVASSRALWERLDAIRRDKPAFAAALNAEQKRGARWVEPRLVADIEFRGWTADGHLRHAAFKGLREDKEASEVVREDKAPARKRAGAAASGSVAGVKLTHPDRVLWQGQGLTKQGLAEFYAEIADWILPHIVDRPLALVRCPSGSENECFFQKHAWAGLDPVIDALEVAGPDGPEQVLAIKDLKGLIALVQVGVLEIHPWGAALGDVERPDRLIFDLDPSEDVGYERVVEAAREVRDRLAESKLVSFLKTTGGKGLHVVVPLKPSVDWDEAKAFAKGLADGMAADGPEGYTAVLSKKARKGRIFVDYLRNGRGATAVAAYSTRARAGAPISTPLSWEELSPAVRPNYYSVANLLRRLASVEDPWREFAKARQSLKASRRGRR